MSDTYLANGSRCDAPRTSKPMHLMAPALRRRIGAASKPAGAEPYDALLWRIEAHRAASTTPSRLIGFIGCEHRTGATTIAANLALRASELGMGPVLLVETDVERPQLRKAWRLAGGPGLLELMEDEASLADCLCDGPAPDLHVLPAAARAAHCGQPWEAGAVEALLAEAAADHSLVLFDLPAADRMQHALSLAQRLDQALLVVRAEQTRGPLAQRRAERLVEDGVPLAGVILNRQRRYVPRWLTRWF